MARINKDSTAKRLQTMRKKKKAGGIWQYLTPAQRKAQLKKMQAGRKRQRKQQQQQQQQQKQQRKNAWQQRYRAAQKLAHSAPLNGHPSARPTDRIQMRARGMAKDSFRALAIEGAKVRLQQLEQERQVLIMFIGKEPA
jgi:hypothetical protein